MNKTLLSKSDSFWFTIITVISVVVVAVVGLLLLYAQSVDTFREEIYLLPKLNAIINSTVTLLLITGYFLIINKKIALHKICMLTAFCLSILFLFSYITYHFSAPHTGYGGEGMVRNIYFFILISHIILAVFIIPMALLTLYRIFNNQVSKHRNLARWTLPLWLYVSSTGVIIYLMISPYYPV